MYQDDAPLDCLSCIHEPHGFYFRLGSLSLGHLINRAWQQPFLCTDINSFSFFLTHTLSCKHSYVMRHLFHSKDHKQQQSLRLQKELQKEEETLWKIEQEKRKLQEELDMKMAKKLQEEMEQREQNPQRQEQQQQPELTDEEVARRLQEELNRGQSPTHDSSPSPVAAPATPAPVPPAPLETRSNQELSDEQYARMLQEQFEAEERQAQGQHASPSPALPPRTVSSTPSSSSVAPPPLPSKPVAYNHCKLISWNKAYQSFNHAYSNQFFGIFSITSIMDTSREQ